MTYNYSKLRGKIREVFNTQAEFARALELSKTSLSEKLNGKSAFTQPEIEKSIELLNIARKDIPLYFYNLEVK